MATVACPASAATHCGQRPVLSQWKRADAGGTGDAHAVRHVCTVLCPAAATMHCVEALSQWYRAASGGTGAGGGPAEGEVEYVTSLVIPHWSEPYFRRMYPDSPHDAPQLLRTIQYLLEELYPTMATP